MPCHIFSFLGLCQDEQGAPELQDTSLNKTRASLSLSQLEACPSVSAGHKPSSSVWGEHVAAAGCRDGACCVCVKDRAGAIGFCVAEIAHRVPELLPTGFPLVHQFQYLSGQSPQRGLEAIC